MKFALKVWLAIILVPLALWLGGLALIAALPHMGPNTTVMAVLVLVGALIGVARGLAQRQGGKS